MVPILFGVSLNPFNSALISICLVLIADSLRVPIAHTLWLVSGFYIASAVAQPILGNLADRVAAFPMFVAGLILVGLAGVLGGLAQDLPTLTVARVLLALGTAATYPSAIVMVRARSRQHPGWQASRALSAIALVQQVGSALGPPVGGAMVGMLGWRAAFLINIPLAALCLVLALWMRRSGSVPDQGFSGAVAEHDRVPKPPLDHLGNVLFAVPLGLLFLATTKGPIPDALIWGGAALAFALLCWWERRVAAPLIDVRLFARSPRLSWIFLRFLVAGTILYAIMILWPQWLQEERGLSVAEVGLLLVPLGVLAPGVAYLARRTPPVSALWVAHGAQLMGAVLLLAMTSNAPVWLLVACICVFAVPTALLHMGNQAVLYEVSPPEQTGTLMGLLRSVWYLGAVAAAGLGGIFFPHRATTEGLHDLGLTLVVGAALICAVDLGATVGFRLRRRGRGALIEPARRT